VALTALLKIYNNLDLTVTDCSDEGNACSQSMKENAFGSKGKNHQSAMQRTGKK